jgi:ribose transport system ATP-binding protein
MDKLLAMNQITKSFYGVSVLKGVDFDLDYGEVHVLLGENGAGKSTLMKILCGAYTLDSGSISIAGRPVELAGYDPRKAEDAGIVTVYQNFHLVPHFSVAENLSLARFTRQRGLIHWKAVNDHAREALEKVGFAIDPRTKVRDLPVSQKQMLEIAIALSKNAKIIIMDEPTAALSRKETENLFKTISEIKSRRVGVIYISHKLEEVKQVGDRITVLRDGLKIATLENRDADLNRIITLMIGKEVSRTRRESAVEATGAAFEARGLQNGSFPFPLSFSVREGEILGVTGLVGSGKTELARALFGIDRLSAGVLLLNGKPVRIDSPRKAVNLGIGYLSEDRDTDGLCLNLGVKENVSLVVLAKLRSLFFNVTEERHSVGDLVSGIGLKTAGLSQQVKYLSGGNKQKVVFGKWLTARCRLLILDEPTMGIDVGARGDIYGLIRRFVQEKDRAVVFISSDVDEILEVSDRILVMVGGEVAAVLDSKTATKQEIMRYSTHVAQGVE